jgi:peptidoglycan/LPS O-acetylase OafA/YrhL
LGIVIDGALAAPDTDAAREGVARRYRPELDAVRFLAFLLVFLFHALPVPLIGRPGWRVNLSLMEACALGLCLFFTLSAYLITDILLTERENNTVISVKKFYIRRILRIWPLYFFGIALGIVIAIAINRPGDINGFVWYLLFAGNLYCIAFGWLGNPFAPLWTISIEEQFYFLWPWAIRRFSRRGLVACSLLFILAANLTLWILGQRHADMGREVWANTLVQFEMFAAGILLALAKKRLAWQNSGVGLILVLTGPVLWFFACYRYYLKQSGALGMAMSGTDLIVRYVLIALGCAAILQGFCMIGPSHIPQWAAYLGKISYGLYVYHLLSIEFAHALFSSMHGLAFVITSALVALLLTIAIAVISYALLESPFLRIKRRFEIIHTRSI